MIAWRWCLVGLLFVMLGVAGAAAPIETFAAPRNALALLKTPSGLWVGCYGNGVWRHTATGWWQVGKATQPQYITSLALAPSGKLYAGTYMQEGLLEIDPQQVAARVIPWPHTPAGAWERNYTRAMDVACVGTKVYVSTFAGLLQWDTAAKHWTALTKIPLYLGNHTRLCIDAHGLWTTYTKDDPQRPTATWLVHRGFDGRADVKAPIPGLAARDAVVTIAPEKGRLLLGTEQGSLFVFNLATQRFTTVFTHQVAGSELCDMLATPEAIYLAYGDGNLPGGEVGGIAVYDRHTKQLRNLTGLPGKRWNGLALVNGSLWAAGKAGVAHIPPDVLAAQPPVLPVDHVTVTPAWQQEMPEPFTFAASADGSRIAVRWGDQPGKSRLTVYDGSGKVAWQYVPGRGKVFAPQISADGKRVGITQVWTENAHAGPIHSVVMVRDGAFSKLLASHEFVDNSAVTTGQWNADGTRLLCTTRGKSGVTAELAAYANAKVATLWKLSQVTPPLTHLTGADWLPDGSGVLLSSARTLYGISATGRRNWELAADGPVAFTTLGNLLAVWSPAHDEWPWALRKADQASADVFHPTLATRDTRLGLYLLNERQHHRYTSTISLLAGIRWPEGVQRDGQADEIVNAAICREGDTAVLAVAGLQQMKLYRLPIYGDTPAPEITLPTPADRNIRFACSQTPGLLAIATMDNKQALFALYDLQGRKRWEEHNTGTHGDIALSADGRRLYARAGNVLYAYTIAH